MLSTPGPVATELMGIAVTFLFIACWTYLVYAHEWLRTRPFVHHKLLHYLPCASVLGLTQYFTADASALLSLASALGMLLCIAAVDYYQLRTSGTIYIPPDD